MLQRDLDAAARTLATAFVDDPMVAWLSGLDDRDERAVRSVPGFFAPALEIGRPKGHCYTAADGGAVALWSPPDVEMFGDEGGAVLGAAVIAAFGAEAIERLIALGETVSAHHPHDRPHFYLFLLGAATKGTGVGSRAMQPVLERCDADGLPAYLESSSARNVSFYERHGFRVVWEAAPEGGPTFRGMWREPGSGRG